ncbi:MAG TPA: hypothetical protein VMT38_05450 [Terracidiphilus sp.]|nr:hypothetical protein [Terracidiphilus sp.]
MPSFRAFILFAAIAAIPLSLHAQDAQTISIRLLDGKTGLPVKASNFLVRVDHYETVHPEWVKIGDDNAVTITLPPDAKQFSIKATYDDGMDTYINCDAAKESDKERNVWYSIATVVNSGIVAPNECAKTSFKAKPGEFIFFVRKRSWHDNLE